MSRPRSIVCRWACLVLVAGYALGCEGPPEPETPTDTRSDTAGGEEPVAEGQDTAPSSPPSVPGPSSATAPPAPASSGASSGHTAGGPAAAPEENPWGATRAEQCQAPPRNPLSAAARPSFDAGVRAAAVGDSEAAVASFRQALRDDREAYPAAYNLGVLSDRAGRTAEALELYRQALRIQGDYEAAARGMVTIFLRQGAVPDAYAFIQPLARRYPTNLHIQALYADVLVTMGRFDGAWEAARAALRCDERFVPALLALIRASRAQGRNELADSILDQALAIDAQNAELRYLNGIRLRGQPGRLREAMDELRLAVSLRPDYTEARMALGAQLLAGGNYAEALQQFEAAARLAPTLAAVHLSLADALRASRQWERARGEYEAVLRMSPEAPEAHFGLGLLYLTAAEQIPGMDELSALQKATEHLTRYRNIMGPRLPRDDASGAYLTDLERRVQRVQRRLERERRDRERGAEGATAPAEGGST